MCPGDMRQAFGLARLASVNARGEETYSTATVYPCRFQSSDRLARTADGSQVVASGVLFTRVPVTEKDLIWPPGTTAGDVSTSRRPISVATRYSLETGLVEFYAVTF